ncbi:MAG: ribbon-helix-helix domain-containing protein [Acidimicrobiales bacterium]
MGTRADMADGDSGTGRSPFTVGHRFGCTTPVDVNAVRYSGTNSGTRGEVMARTHVILGDEVIEAIDQLVGQRGRSRFLDQAAREKLERLELEHALASTAGVLKSKDYPEFEDQASINEWVRAQRRTEEAS